MDAIITVKKRFSLGELRTGLIKLKPILEERTVLPNEHEQIVVPNEGADGLSKVTVEPVELIEKTITKAGVYRASDEGVSGYSVVNAATDRPNQMQMRVDGCGCKYLFYGYTGESLTPSGFDTSKVENFYGMFLQSENLVNLDLRNLDTSNATDISNMFQDCRKLENIYFGKNFNTSNVTKISSTFNFCNIKTLDLANWDVKNITHAESTFYYCISLTDINFSGWNTPNLQYFRLTFYACRSLKSLDLSSWGASPINMEWAFSGCEALENINLNGWDSSNCTNFNLLFSSNISLTTIYGTLDLYSATNLSHMFMNTYVLKGVTLKNIRKSLQIGSGTSYGHNWLLSYLINAIKELWDNSSGTQQTLTIGSENMKKIEPVYVKLVDVTDEMTAADPYAANKLPCVECDSTDEGAMTLETYAMLKNWEIK